MIESRADAIKRLIHQNVAEHGQLGEQLRSFEQMPDIGCDGRDNTDQWKQVLRKRIAERESLVTDLEALQARTRDTI